MLSLRTCCFRALAFAKPALMKHQQSRALLRASDIYLKYGTTTISSISLHLSVTDKRSNTMMIVNKPLCTWRKKDSNPPRLEEGAVYEGDLKDGVFHGRGKLIYHNGNVYEGDFEGGKPSGQGKTTFHNGDVHEGGLKDGVFHGQGKFACHNGDVYEGDFEGGVFHGQGKFTFHNGDIHEGGLKDSVFHGQGKLIYHNGDVYEGDFEGGRPSSQGKFTFHNGDIHEGGLKDGVFHGRGKLIYHNGDVYEGDFEGGRPSGQGKLIYLNGNLYEGGLKDGVFHGRGKFIYHNGDVYEGDFKDGVFQNGGNVSQPDGTVFGKGNAQSPPADKRGLVGGAIFAGSLLFGKTKYVLAALKITKMAPLASMLITSATYSLFFGWPYAVGMVGLIFVHECGHAVAMRHYDVPFSPMVFIPFMGAVISMKDVPRNAYQEGVIGLAGPVAGSAAALSLGVAGAMLDSQLMLALADWGYIINLFNLMPVGSMDGGRVLGAVSPYFGVAGLLGGAGCIYYDLIGNPLFYLIMLGGTYSSVQRVMGWDEKHLPPNYYNLSSSSQSKLFASYLALVASLLAAMTYNNQRRKSPERLRREQNGESFSSKSFEDDEWDRYSGPNNSEHSLSLWDNDKEN